MIDLPTARACYAMALVAYGQARAARQAAQLALDCAAAVCQAGYTPTRLAAVWAADTRNRAAAARLADCLTALDLAEAALVAALPRPLIMPQGEEACYD